jgi:hypothetical protein
MSTPSHVGHELSGSFLVEETNEMVVAYLQKVTRTLMGSWTGARTAPTLILQSWRPEEGVFLTRRGNPSTSNLEYSVVHVRATEQIFSSRENGRQPKVLMHVLPIDPAIGREIDEAWSCALGSESVSFPPALPPFDRSRKGPRTIVVRLDGTDYVFSVIAEGGRVRFVRASNPEKMSLGGRMARVASDLADLASSSPEKRGMITSRLAKEVSALSKRLDCSP